MALSYITESEAPRDFRVSSTDSDGHYTKCVLCYTVKKSFYCPDCIRAGNFGHSSMPYSDKFTEQQAKLARIKANRKHVLDRCEKLLATKIKKDTLMTEVKQSRDKIDLLRLAIEQRRSNIEDKRKELTELVKSNSELRLKLPRYQKRVSSLGQHSEVQSIELQNKVSVYHDKAQLLAALRRSRIRQLTKYIFPIYMSYDTSESIEDMEFVGDDPKEEPPKRSQLHIVSPWIDIEKDLTTAQAWTCASKDGGVPLSPSTDPLQRSQATIALAAQLCALLAWTLDVRLPYPVNMNEYYTARVSEGGYWWRARRVYACCGAVCARAAVPPPTCQAPLAALHSLSLAATADDPMLGRVEAWTCDSLASLNDAWGEMCATNGDEPEEDVEPEHLNWSDTMEMEELSCTPPQAPPASLVTSAAASLAGFWRGWTK